MRKKWFAFGCLTSILIIVFSFVLVVRSVSKLGTQKKTKIADNSYLHIKLSGTIYDYNEIKDNFFHNENLFAHDIIEKVEKATKDDRISGIILEPSWISGGFATLNEIMLALENFQASGKEVVAYLEVCGNRDYYLASVADEIVLNPSASAGILLTGIGTNILFYKDVLDKLGIEMQVIHAGKFKGAGEPFTRNEMSPPFRESIAKLFSDIYEKMISELAENRQLTDVDVRKIYENRMELFINQENAIEYNLVDNLMFHDDFMKGRKTVKLADYHSFMPSNFTKDKVAVIYAQGSIVKQKTDFMATQITSQKIAKICEKIAKDNSVKAVVLRVNSPGGSALESEIIFQHLQKINKPIVVSMGNVAASGGYYIAANADYIFADPFTITGSIGVVAMYPNLKKFSDKIGIHSDPISKGKFSNITDPFLETKSTTIAAMKIGIEATYQEFKNRVADGRNMSITEVEKIAQGRIWSSNDALENNLIDEVGSQKNAIQKAAELAEIANYSVKYFPKQKTLTEIFLKEKFNFEMVSNLFVPNILNDAKQLYNEVKNDPIQMRQLMFGTE
ncbi:MAG: signal peptide peptidase SppA [Candidatus Cloacimonetes bacterium]|jgi:protease IV|nr:signal peptide peptidase SppA [Candidatus Cloacimonadota bacterium]